MYLTKFVDGKLHHYLAEVKNSGVKVVEGVVYNTISEYFEGFGSVEAANSEYINRISQKLKEGFVETPYISSAENTMNVYDKAKWHFDGDFPPGLDHFQGYIHTGMFLGWLIDTDLVSDRFAEDMVDQIKALKSRRMTGPRIFEFVDGVLALDDLNEQGNRFALSYFDFSTGQYLGDYENLLASSLPTLYHVKDTWANYELLKVNLDARFKEWMARTSHHHTIISSETVQEKIRRSWWRFW